MKILKIDIENYKKIKAFNCNLDGNNLIVSGEPDEGKTTAISSLWELLESRQDALTHGEKKGHIRVTLGENGSEHTIIAERKFTPKTNTIVITDSEGRKLSKKTIQDMLNAVTYEPLAMMDLKGLELTKFLLKSVKLPAGYDIEELDNKRKELEEERLFKGRDADRLTKEVGEEPEKVEKVDVKEISESIDKINEYENKLTVMNYDRNVIEGNIQTVKNEIESLSNRLKGFENDLEELNLDIVDVEAEFEGCEFELKDALVKKYENAVEINSSVNEWNNWNERSEKAKKARLEYKEVVEKIKKIDADKKTAMNEAEYPVNGLIIEDGKVYYEGNLLENCGTEKQMLVSASLVASQINGIKAMRIDRAESMGDSGRKKLIDICEKLGVQICMSRVTDGEQKENEIRIVEGVYNG